jgi:hypothetical protein
VLNASIQLYGTGVEASMPPPKIKFLSYLRVQPVKLRARSVESSRPANLLYGTSDEASVPPREIQFSYLFTGAAGGASGTKRQIQPPSERIIWRWCRSFELPEASIPLPKIQISSLRVLSLKLRA